MNSQPKRKKRGDERKAQVQIAQSDTAKRKLLGLWMAGETVGNISKALNCSEVTCRAVLKVVLADMAAISPDILKDMVRQSFTELLNNYKVRSSMLFKNLLDAEDKDSRTLYEAASAQQQNDKSFIDLVERMGVPRGDADVEKREPTQTSTHYENPNISKSDALKQLKTSVNRTRNYLNELERNQKALDAQSKKPEETS